LGAGREVVINDSSQFRRDVNLPFRSIRINEPIGGAILNRQDGKQTQCGLEVSVCRIAPWKSKVTVNGVEAKVRRDGCGFFDRFKRDIVLKERENRVIAPSPFTTMHWGEAKLEGCKALRDNGIIGLVGYFVLDEEVEKPVVSYYLDKERTMYLSEHDYWKDINVDLFFIKHDLVINLAEPSKIEPKLDSISSNPHRSKLMEVMIHKQYFHPELKIYEPDTKDRVVATLNWLTKNGYKSIFYEEGFLGA